MKAYFTLLFAVAIALTASAHPGKTDRQGGHKCYKECAEWDLYYAEYHLHDKEGRTVKAVKKKSVKARPEAAPVEEKAVGSADSPGEAAPSQPAAVSAGAAIEADTPLLPWILLVLFLLLLLVVRRNRRKKSGMEQTTISR